MRKVIAPTCADFHQRNRNAVNEFTAGCFDADPPGPARPKSLPWPSSSVGLSWRIGTPAPVTRRGLTAANSVQTNAGK